MNRFSKAAVAGLTVGLLLSVSACNFSGLTINGAGSIEHLSSDAKGDVPGKPISTPNPTVTPTPGVTPELTVTPPATPAAGGRYLGINLATVSAVNETIYANILRSARPWTILNTDNLAALDANGWPTGAAEAGYAEGSGYPAYFNDVGFSLRFRGSNTTVSSRFGDDLISGLSAPDANGYRTATVKRTGNNPVVRFSGAFQDATMMLPGHTLGVDYFNKDFLAFLAPFSLIRTMQATGPGMDGIPWNPVNTATMGDHDPCGPWFSSAPMTKCWSSRHSRPMNDGQSYNGMSWEDVVVLANLTGKDVWINIPLNVGTKYFADPDYVTKMAQVFKYGSDGTNPFTSTTTHDPATWTPANAINCSLQTCWWPGLLPDRHVYVEFSNEVWNYDYWAVTNSAGGDKEAQDEICAGDPHNLNYDGKYPCGHATDPNDNGRGGPRWVAWKTVQTSLLWRQVWGSVNGPTDQVRIVMASQGDMGSWWTHRDMLAYIDKVWGNCAVTCSGGANTSSLYLKPFTNNDATLDGLPSGFANPKQLVSYYLHNISGSFYVHWYNPSSVDQAFAQMNTSLGSSGGLSGAWESNSLYERIDYGQTLATMYGIKFSTYETGNEINPGALADACDADPRMNTLTLNMLHRFYAQSNADVAVYFWSTGYALVDAALVPNFRTLNTQRYNALKAVAAGR